MIGREKRMLLRHYLEEGQSKSAVARKLGISRDTLHRLIRTGQLDRDLDEEPVRYKARRPVATKLEPYKPMLLARLKAYPELSAERLYREIQAAGYPGGYTQVKEFVRKARPRPAPEPVVRFETAPGHQMQVDWAEFRFPWGVRHALVVVLGFSRLLWFRFFERQDMPTLMRGLEEAFAYFGGVTREGLFDQMKTVITKDERAKGGRLVENEEFLRFARHWSFQVRACRAYRAQTKGKVERPVGYIRRGFAYGRDFLNDADLDEQRARWLDQVANARVHRTTGRRPRELFEERERASLLPPAERPYRSLVLLKSEAETSTAAPRPEPQTVQVERRPLSAYARIAAGAA